MMDFTFDQILQFIVGGITNGSIYAIVAIGFTIIFNSTEIINFAQGEFVMLGALMMVTFSSILGMHPVFGFILSVFSVTIIGILFDLLIIKPVRKPSHISLIIITVGASIFIKGVAMMFWGKNPYPSKPFSGDNPIIIWGAAVIPQTIWILSITIVTLVFLHFFFEYTITGKGMRACAINRRAASLLGIRVNKMILLSFALSGGLGAVAGIIISPITFAGYGMGTMLGLKGFCAAIIGGIGSIPGAILGGFSLGVLESMGAGLISSAYKDAIAFLALLLVLFIRPSGILGKGEVKRV
jgi:branched-chain amino acid transport system permease protein